MIYLSRQLTENLSPKQTQLMTWLQLRSQTKKSPLHLKNRLPKSLKHLALTHQ